MKPIKQTRLHKGLTPVSDRGNCFPACIASILEMECEDVIQIQELYDNDMWCETLQHWLNKRGYRWRALTGDDNILDKHILVTGKSPRHPDCTHVVIYLNGKMVHDPHPDNAGILDEQYFEIIEAKN